MNTFTVVLAFHSLPNPLLAPVDKMLFKMVSTIAKQKV